MKKYLLLLILPFLFITSVKADTIQVSYPNSQEWLFSNCGSGDTKCTTFLKPDYINQKYDLDFMYQQIINKYNEEYSETYPYYIVNFINESKSNGDLYYNKMYLSMYSSNENINPNNYSNQLIYTYENGTYTLTDYLISGTGTTVFSSPVLKPIEENYYVYSPLLIYDTNIDLTNDTNSTYVIETISLTISPGDTFTPYLETANADYIQVNLDSYEYILLSLKNYNQIEPFQTNLQIKGQIGITPIYNYGQTSKDAITGSQVQDRCNVNYEIYTNYPFYIIQTDLQNNVIYAVKSCSEGSSFKFNSNIFNITYVTTENEQNPTITINGQTYNVIPYDDLPSTATKNEEENYIPGESGSATDTGGLDSAIKNAQNRLSEIWNTITYFTSFVGLLFSALPSELSTILISAFVVVTVLGIIKLFVGH